jgi:hypothetical protein
MILSTENSRAPIDSLQRVFGAEPEASRFSKRLPLQSPFDAVAQLAAKYEIASLNSAVRRGGTAPKKKCSRRWSAMRDRRNDVVIRYEDPTGGPGMPEMLARTPAIRRAGLWKNLVLVNDGRFNGRHHAFSAGHITRETRGELTIATIRPGDRIKIDAPISTRSIAMPDSKLALRRWSVPP